MTGWGGGRQGYRMSVVVQNPKPGGSGMLKNGVVFVDDLVPVARVSE